MTKVCVLLSTYNGEEFLEEQLDSLVRQNGVEVDILVRDDGSSDRTCEILNKWQNRGLLRWYTGKNLCPARSFMDLIYHAPDTDYYAFCDQDDVWLPDKLRRAVEKLENKNDEYSLYLSPTILVDKDLNVIGRTNLNFKYTLGESLVTFVATGCTMVFNKKLKSFVENYSPRRIYMHDDWIYKTCLAMNGFLYIDKDSYIYYRQHGNNVVGAKTSFYSKMKRRFNNLFCSKDGIRYMTIREFYFLYKGVLPDESLNLVKKANDYKGGLLKKISFILDKRLSAPRLSTILNFYIAVIFNKY